MCKGRIEWEGGVRGQLVIRLDEPVCIQDSRELVDYLYENGKSDYCVHFAPEEVEVMGAIALFMAIREQAPYERGYVLDHAASKVGGMNFMGGIDFPMFRSPVDSARSEITQDFTRSCRRLAASLHPIQTDSQYALKCAAFEYIEELMSDD